VFNLQLPSHNYKNVAHTPCVRWSILSAFHLAICNAAFWGIRNITHTPLGPQLRCELRSANVCEFRKCCKNIYGNCSIKGWAKECEMLCDKVQLNWWYLPGFLLATLRAYIKGYSGCFVNI